MGGRGKGGKYPTESKYKITVYMTGWNSEMFHFQAYSIGVLPELYFETDALGTKHYYFQVGSIKNGPNDLYIIQKGYISAGSATLFEQGLGKSFRVQATYDGKQAMRTDGTIYPAKFLK